MLSPPGVFAGYSFDTLGTRLGLEFPSNGVRLSTLARYRHVIWLVDRLGGTFSNLSPAFPITALRHMSTPGRPSSLGGYTRAGGRVWLCGGAAATAATDEFNLLGNDNTSGHVYSTPRELGVGRIMYDGAHWRSAFTTTQAGIRLLRSARAEQIADRPWSHRDAFTGAPLRSPDYRRLPAEMRWRDPATDPLPPTRTSQQGSLYYRSGFTCEYLFVPNVITEDVDPDLDVEHVQAVLDTLMDAHSVLLRTTPAPVMTWYHGREANHFVFSGFAPWDFRREDCIRLADFVLQDLWGLPRQPVDRGVAPVTASARSASPSRRLGSRP